MEIDLEDWEDEIPVRGGSVVVAHPPDRDTFEIEVFTGDEWVRLELTGAELRQLHAAIGVLLGD